MSKCYRILTAILLAGALGGFTWFVLRPQEPVYGGKPLSVWLDLIKVKRPMNRKRIDKIMPNKITAMFDKLKRSFQDEIEGLRVERVCLFWPDRPDERHDYPERGARLPPLAL